MLFKLSKMRSKGSHILKTNNLTFEQIFAKLKKKEFQPIYFLHGTESYYIDAISDYIEANALNEAEKAFNQTILYGKEADHLAVVDNARRYPMMASHQVVLLKEAQEMKSLKGLQSYIEKPLNSTILVICHKHKKFNLNSKFGKALNSNALVFESKAPYESKMPDWINNYLTAKKFQISPQASELIAEYLGNQLSKVANELDKLAINLAPGTKITPKHIEENIGISKDYNVFELQKALGQRDVLKANRIVNYFAANPRKNPLTVVIASLYNYFSKIYMLHFLAQKSEKEILSGLKLRSSYFLKEYRQATRNFSRSKTEQVISILKDFDLMAKGLNYNTVGKPDGELLKELVWRILH